ncbi:hypothetical protein [Tenacibaculum sp. M341]|uniref:hypothetical protein n=1 Tax=Tenacibaculum sp. M341 TaxID=2530339 RepID=UPI001046DCC8|nr:hypothetical protein [Tenacibaculum sp. M341]TCI93644.1 hypothetical protein EYW44_04320 [Tenacibaculum sp. M341]
MNNYKSIVIIHAKDNSTLFLSKFKEEFDNIYYSFSSDEKSIQKAKELICDLEPKSLIIYLGHGSSSGLYIPDNTFDYQKYFIDTTQANFYFDEHDIFLLTCKSNEFIKKIYKPNFSIGFGNIISSKEELDHHNKYSEIKKILSVDEIDLFNNIYVKSSIKVIKLLINEKIQFIDLPKYLRFQFNQEINKILLNKKNNNRIELAKLLFELRNKIVIKQNLRS